MNNQSDIVEKYDLAKEDLKDTEEQINNGLVVPPAKSTFFNQSLRKKAPL